MTCIVAVKHGTRVYLGGDSAASSGYDSYARADEKVFTNGDFILGFTTSFRMGQLLRYNLEVPKQPVKMGDLKYVSTIFIDSVRNCLKNGGFARKINENESGGNFLVGYKQEIYEIQEDYQVAKPLADYHAIGCGASYALGAMFCARNLSSVLSPKRLITLALKAAAEYSSYVKEPFHIIKK